MGGHLSATESHSVGRKLPCGHRDRHRCARLDLPVRRGVTLRFDPKTYRLDKDWLAGQMLSRPWVRHRDNHLDKCEHSSHDHVPQPESPNATWRWRDLLYQRS
jgi:hypothetical protein